MRPDRSAGRAVATALSERVNCHTGAIQASGELTRQGADLLWGTVESLRRMGHRSVLLDLRNVHSADENGVAALFTVSRTIGENGVRLLIRTSTGVTDTSSKEAWPRIRHALALTPSAQSGAPDAR